MLTKKEVYPPWRYKNGRLHRSGQVKPVRAYALLYNKTIDEQILAPLRNKRAVSDIALDELKGVQHELA